MGSWIEGGGGLLSQDLSVGQSGIERGGVRNRSPLGPRNSFDKFFLREKGSKRRMGSSFLSSPCQNKVVRWLGEESVERERRYRWNLKSELQSESLS